MSGRNFAQHTGNRRRFLESSAGVAAGVMTFGAVSGETANTNLHVGVIGVRARGRQLLKRLTDLSNVSIQAICDVDPTQAQRASGELRDAQREPFRIEQDYRSVLAAGDIDAVVIATPDHWHATMCVAALDAHKHVFVETPLAHSAEDTNTILAAADNSDRVVFCGMQQRSMPHMQSALDHIASGHLGSVRLARAWTSHRRKSIGIAPDGPPPIDVDYDTWLGPAPRREFNPNRFHYSWRWFWDYGGGELTNWGVHMIDIARLGLFGTRINQELSGDVPVPDIRTTGGKYYFTDDDQETPDTLTAHYDFGDRTLIWEHRQWCSRQIEGRSAGVAFYGENGTLILDRGGWKVYDSSEKVAATDSSTGDTIVEDFIRNVRTNRLGRDSLAAIAKTTNLCHAANTRYREA